ncbi:U2 small nuclear ribonucleoprotein auxiliary factor 35 kDa subunit-related protein 1-like [Notolabrus celidotus]|uniref:U2 small nuclear ribonucleoprotein auxiliary factor 35 kDa subunit-related protein 1-like n=1 Tax=Notolabrus celidotus TaxID=1203425 RepID=UPI00148F9C6B|nr:U2 small nuclear ribonucleoprotein auxiliary factor 35 kDa subunit-related protein 1-like [Notolabrus celidotus]
MAHEKRFKGIPMSKSMRGLCKEEDYAFLGISEKTEGAGVLEDNWRGDKEKRIRWRQEREQKEKERLREIEESRKEKEQQWRTHVANVTSSQEKTLQDRLARLRRFREFQRKVLVEESGQEVSTAILTANQLLTRM